MSYDTSHQVQLSSSNSPHQPFQPRTTDQWPLTTEKMSKKRQAIKHNNSPVPLHYIDIKLGRAQKCLN
jgi:hypothetical protein